MVHKLQQAIAKQIRRGKKKKKKKKERERPITNDIICFDL
jgi:hypothetical protein